MDWAFVLQSFAGLVAVLNPFGAIPFYLAVAGGPDRATHGRIVLAAAERMHGRIGRTGITVIGRVMGLVLVAMAVQFIADGLRVLFPALAS